MATTPHGSIEELTDDSPKVESPSEFQVHLKEHQKTLIARCIELENEGINTTRDASLNRQFKSMRGNIGIIGDKVGSGKTYSILGLIHQNAKPLVIHRIVRSEMYGMGNIYAELQDRQDFLEHVGMTLIVVPHSIIKQWLKCIQRCFLAKDFTVVNTTKSYELVSRSTLLNKKLMLVSGTFYRRIQELAYDESIHFNRIVFDEADSMNVPGARRIPATFYWFVSASFKNILTPYPRWVYGFNHIGVRGTTHNYQISAGIANNAFAKNIFTCFYRDHAAMSRILNKIVVKNDDSFVDRSFELPEMNVELIECRDSGLITILNGVVSNNIMSSLNAGDVRGAVAHINQANVDTETNIIDGVLKGFSNKLNNVDVAIRYTTDCIMAQDVKERKLAALSTERDELVKKMNLVQQRIRETQICTICLEAPRTKTITKCCKNSFCFECLASWLRKKSNCPLCKTSVSIEEDIYVVKDGDAVVESIDTRPSKIGYLERHLSEMSAENKMLIFSENDNSFIAIEDILKNLDVRYAKLKGNSINRAVQEYKEGDLQVLLVNSNAYGSGLNLENTTEVILFHKFGNEAETQVLGRAQRPGRLQPLKVLYLLNENEMDRST